ncbi:MAG TPA: metal-dependent hydrolase, partial [Thermoproteota archaeon]|nr:metal-dependent hydrolase [Thermoproteota archaeon]
MMTSTHMAAGFVLSGISYRILAQLFPYDVRPGLLLLFPYVLVAGLVGGLFPDLDRIDREILGFRIIHRRTLHYIVAYACAGGMAAALLVLHPEQASILGPLFAFLLSAWLHTVMDVFDGRKKGTPGAVYEHITRKWIRGKEVIPFASTKEWILSSAIA